MDKIVDRFCIVCSEYSKSKPCFVEAGSQGSQRRYALREWCGWGTVDGHRAIITRYSVDFGSSQKERDSETGLLKKTAETQK